MTTPRMTTDGPHSTSPRQGRVLFLGGGLALLALLGIYFIQRDALKYAEFAESAYQRFWPVRFSLAMHVLSATIALAVAPLQFVTAIRRRWPRFHRFVGWSYVVGALVSAPVVLRLSLAAPCIACRTPFVVWSVVWVAATVLAIIMAVQRNFDAHRQFMVRSYVLMLGFVFIRLETHLELPLGTMSGYERAATVIWISWVVPYAMTEIWLAWSPLVNRHRKPRWAAARRATIGDAADV